jgi:hypothetical protein
MSSLEGNTQRKQVIRRVLEETGFAYTLNCECGAGNADYAEYVSAQALDSFKAALKNPNLSYEDLCRLLRKATRREAQRSCKTPWSVFMANYLDKHANSDDVLSPVN